MFVDKSGQNSLTIEDLPRLVAAIAEIEPDRPALSFEGVSVSYADLHQQLTDLDTAMGGVLGPDALIPMVVSGALPGLVESRTDGLGAVVSDLLADAGDVVPDMVASSDTVEETLVSLFESQVERSPDAIALEFDGTELTYRQFDSAANQLARELIRRGVGPDRLVGVAIKRSIDMLVAIYAVVKAGGAYVPLDPDHPAERIAYVIETARPVLVLTSSHSELPIPSETAVLAVDSIAVSDRDTPPLASSERLSPLRSADTAYVIFTSGSTGRPKGVAVSHAAIVENLLWRQSEYGFTPDDVILQKTPFTFDVSVWELFWPLQVGAKLLIATHDGHRDPAYLTKVIVDRGVTAIHFVPSMLAVYLAEPAAALVTSLRLVFASGEALPGRTAARFRAISGAELHNLYGPTEAAVDVTYHRTSDLDQDSVPIGQAVTGTALHVLDDGLRPVPTGVPGELYLAGPQLARGYVERADLTADRFVANPHGASGERMYRTGDLVRWRGTGSERTLEYIGRTDFQVKLRGLRIELGEIESVLLQDDSISQVVATVRTVAGGDALVAYLVPVAGAVVDHDSLASAASRNLPDYMVPDLFVELDEFPLNSSGKLDRKALPEPDFERSKVQYRAPETDTEIALVQIFGELLDVGEIGIDDSFFSLGGNSLSATRLVTRVNSHFGVDVEVRAFFDAPDIARFAVIVDQANQFGSTRVPLVAGERPESVPLSSAQQRMWFLNRLEPESAVNNIPIVLRLSGDLDVSALDAAISDVVERHEVLRTVYPDVEGTGVQKVLTAAQTQRDLEVRSIEEDALYGRVVEVVAAGFDVTSEVPFRAELLHVSAREFVLVVVVHHIAGDGFSMGPLTRDLVTAYATRTRGEKPMWEPLAVQYADFAIWQRELLGAENDPSSLQNRQLAYWRSALDGVPEELALPADRQRPQSASGAGSNVDFRIDAELHEGLVRIARDCGTTLFMVVHSALAVLLSRLSATDDIAIGTPVAGRGEQVLDDLVGMFVNTLVLRAEVKSTESFVDLLARVRETDLAAFAHSDVPFERLVEELDPSRSQARHPLFQVILAFQNLDAVSLDLGELTVAAVDFDAEVAKFDLQLTMSETFESDGRAAGLAAAFTYATDLFDKATVSGFADTFVAILRSVALRPDVIVGDVDIVGSELATIVEDSAGEVHEVTANTVVDLFEEMVSRSPHSIAVEDADRSLTYAEFDAESNRLARALIAVGVGPETSVALALRRSTSLVIGVWAILKTGAAYVPLDPEQPIERIRDIVSTSAPIAVLSANSEIMDLGIDVPNIRVDEDDFTRFSAEKIEDHERTRPLHPDNIGYVIFTSGSTGKPKGVAISYASAVSQVAWLIGKYAVAESDAVLFKSPVTFDVSVWEILAPLAAGAKMVVADPDGHRDPAYLTEIIEEHSVTMVSFVPSVLDVFVGALTAGRCPSLRTVFAAGEALPVHTIAAVRKALPAAQLHNLYGPTEFTVHSTAFEVDASVTNRVLIGTPVWNSVALVLDDRLRPVPTGVTGELYLSGVQVARGYMRRVDLTAERFVADPYGTPGTRMYRTGDVVRWSKSGGGIEYIGRSDFQVKLRGLRIELGEIETVLRGHDSVGQAVVLVMQDRLVAYVTAAHGASPAEPELVALAAAALPAYMVPAAIIVLDAIPLSFTGKLDRKALPEPVFSVREFRAPVTPGEVLVAGIFADLLDVPQVGQDDDFFALGGNSLVATQVVARLSAAIGNRIPVRALFDASSVSALAALVDTSGDDTARDALIRQERPDLVPLSMAQQRMWFLNRFDPASGVNNIPAAIRLSGPLDVRALETAIEDVVRRHEILRTVYPDVDGTGRQSILAESEIDIELNPVAVYGDSIEKVVTDLATEGFDVTAQVPFRVTLLELGGEEFVLVLVMHHIASDGYSLGPLTRDIVIAYAARVENQAPAWRPLEVQYADFSIWQRATLGDENDSGSSIAQQIDYWRRTLSGLPEQIELPTDRPRPAVAGNRGASHSFDIDVEMHEALNHVAQENNATLFMVFHAALATLLYRVTGSTDIVVGTPVAGRGEQALDDLIGMFVNTLVLRTEIDPSTSLAGLLEAVRTVDLDAFDNADVPFERLVEVLDPVRSQSHHPLFQVMLTFQNLAQTELRLSGLEISPVDIDMLMSKFDLQLTLVENLSETGAPAGMSAVFTYATDLFDEGSVVVLGERLVRVLGGFVSGVGVGDVDVLG
ncbi:amino acid adenylation domain-containing protein, partial [Rhodococcus qingshengii]